MKKIILFFLLMLAFQIPAFATENINISITLEPKGSGEIELFESTEIALTEFGTHAAKVTTDEDMAIITFWQTEAGNLRVGIKEQNSPGLLVRAEIPTSQLSYPFCFTLNKENNKWKLLLNDLSIDNINWNIKVPDGVDEKSFTSTDDISYCTDYRLPIKGSEKGVEGCNERIDFLQNITKNIQVTMLNNPDNLSIISVEGAQLYDASSNETTENTAITAEIAKPSNKTTNFLLYFAIILVLLLCIAILYVIIKKYTKE